MQERDYYLGFSLVSGIGPKTFLSLLKHCGSAEKAWNSNSIELKNVGLSDRLIQKFEKSRKELDIKSYLLKLKQKKALFIALCDKNYPKLLAQIPNPPIVLFVKGDVSLLQGPVSSFPPASAPNPFGEPSAQNVRAVGSPSTRVAPSLIAIVGTRKITNYGSVVTKLFSFDLASSGFTIVSGLAMGVDAQAAWSAIEAKGKTIAVLGNGVDLCFPTTNENLYDKILDGNGIIVSEFPLGQSPSVGSFPSRNRIIAGLSLGVLVTEGAQDSGSLITADYAFKFNRKVFAVPGPITSSLSVAPLKLIEKGARLVVSPDDILRELKVQSSKLKGTSQNSKPVSLSKEELKVIQAIENESLSFDEIVRKTKIDTSKLSSVISMMEIKGLLKKLNGGLYSRLPLDST